VSKSIASKSVESVGVRNALVEALRLDLVGPGEISGAAGRENGDQEEILSQRPSTWYLTGFLVPQDASLEQKIDEQSNDELDAIGESQSADDDESPERSPARTKVLPSSIGLSFLVVPECKNLKVKVRWGDYRAATDENGEPWIEHWSRQQRVQKVAVSLPSGVTDAFLADVPSSNGLKLLVSARQVPLLIQDSGLPANTRSVSVFLINNRLPSPNEIRDEAYAFQVQLEVQCDYPFVARPDLRSLESDEWDECVADLQYRDTFEYAVGHGVATEAVESEPGFCNFVRTCFIPQGEVLKVEPSNLKDVELLMDVLSRLETPSEAVETLTPLVTLYEQWIEVQRKFIPTSPSTRKETGEQLLIRAKSAAERLRSGIEKLEDPVVFEAFCLANKVMAAAARRRLGVMQGKSSLSAPPKWRPFQLAFLLINLMGIVEPGHRDREIVDLLFFPTGGGKTEAYLGLAAFTLIYRRLTNSDVSSAGLSVLMRYTLRLLTLDQLSRASTLICALELERQKDNGKKLGPWPFEIGLWVGRDATPNRMGSKDKDDDKTARSRTLRFLRNTKNPSPIPLEDCPWCGTKFGKESFKLFPNSAEPTDLQIRCVNLDCDFINDNPLPILAVDEPIYRRLPCFMIATVDKFAALPWTKEVGQFFGKVERYDRDGFYGPAAPGKGMPLPERGLLPPDLIIQDELHLISGPLGTIVGLYESALDELCSRHEHGRKLRPKIVASTATVRRAENQIRALFNRDLVEVFPPPGPDRKNSFFAETRSADDSNPRLYLGIAAFGRSPKVVALRTYVSLLSVAQKHSESYSEKDNPADPYMTLLCYFNSLRELGGARRLIEDEVRNRVAGYSTRKRLSEKTSQFADRVIQFEPVELTSREKTNKVAESKRRLSLPHSAKEHVDVAIATNMISVGLDITRLGLMVVFGQPKTSAEYIQATSRVGRDSDKPGLVVTILNNHKPRDRSHYERFTAYHQSFYRAVEVTSVTPFSPRALDRALAGTVVGLSRHSIPAMVPPLGASEILKYRAALDFVAEVLKARAQSHAKLEPLEADDLGRRVFERVEDLLDEWHSIVDDRQKDGVQVQYQIEKGGAERLLYEFLNPELQEKESRFEKFRANRSMREVEPAINLWAVRPDKTSLSEDAE